MTDHDKDAPRLEDVEEFGDATRRCPQCSTDVYDEADLCYKCGHAFGAEKQATPKPWVLVVIGLVVAAILAPFVLRLI